MVNEIESLRRTNDFDVSKYLFYYHRTNFKKLFGRVNTSS